jgi:hypothetical protein
VVRVPNVELNGSDRLTDVDTPGSGIPKSVVPGISGAEMPADDATPWPRSGVKTATMLPEAGAVPGGATLGSLKTSCTALNGEHDNDMGEPLDPTWGVTQRGVVPAVPS